MVSQSDLLNRVVAIIAGYDDAAWAALASAGLLRRARKDLEKGIEIVVSGEEDGALRIEVPPFAVAMPEAGPGKATCSCPAPGICQHILVAGLFLQENALSASEAEAIPEAITYEQAKNELLAISTDIMREWADAATLRAAAKLVATHPDSVIEESIPVVIRFPALNLVCRFVAGAGLDGLIGSGSARDARKHALAAVLAFQKQHGIALPESAIEKSAATDAAGGARSREAMLNSVQQALRQAVTVGLSHVSPSFRERLATLSVSAQGANLPRLALLLRAVADEAGAIVRREAGGDEARLLLAAARAYALTQAIRNAPDSPHINLIGQARSQYYESQALDLAGVAAYPWRTRSGYRGLTVLFWDIENRQWLSWSHARPEAQRFDPMGAYVSEGPWQGAQSPQQVANSEFKLMNARRNAAGRLSSSSQTRAILGAATRVQQLDFDTRLFTQWAGLVEHAAKIAPLGLRELHPLRDIVVVEPARWDDRYFDEINQTFVWVIRDESGTAMPVELIFEEYTANAIKFLESVPPPPPGSRLVARLVRHPGNIALHPITLLQSSPERPAIQLAFENGAASILGHLNDIPTPEDAEEDVDSEIEQVEELEVSDSPSARRLAALIRLVEELCEAGDGALSEPRAQELRSLAAAFESGGFLRLGQLACDTATKRRGIASELLQLRYLCELHREAMAICD